jgi:hypothetical protein
MSRISRSPVSELKAGSSGTDSGNVRENKRKQKQGKKQGTKMQVAPLALVQTAIHAVSARERTVCCGLALEVNRGT